MIKKANGKINKLVLTIIGILVASVISWSIWVTNGIYGADKEKAVTSQKVTELCSDVNEIKDDMKSVKEDIKKQNEKVNSNQEKILEKLIEINKGIKK
jgi:peptidoglycan hydrolase CwlO-like protein